MRFLKVLDAGRARTFLVSIALFVLIWQVISIYFNNALLPQPLQVLTIFVELVFGGAIFDHLTASLGRVIIGFLAGLFLASILAYTISIFPKLNEYFSPIIGLLRPIPPIAWIPLAILWFGIGNSSSYFIILIAAFFPIFTSLYFGIKSIPTAFKRVSQNYGLSRLQNLTHITIPFTTPHLLTGCKISLGLSWMVVIAAEMIAANSGLGYYIEINRTLLKLDYVVSIMVVIGIVGYLMQHLVLQAEKILVYWRVEANV